MFLVLDPRKRKSMPEKKMIFNELCRHQCEISETSKSLTTGSYASLLERVVSFKETTFDLHFGALDFGMASSTYGTT
jgi:hypothetical protein